jgi:L-serine dehydratase
MAICGAIDRSIGGVALSNEASSRSTEHVMIGLDKFHLTMMTCMYRGLTTPCMLSGGLDVRRRSQSVHSALLARVPGL